MGKFLGSFWGALIGAGCTCWAVIMQKNYADEQRMIDEITGVRPYIVAVHPEYCKVEGKIKLHFAIQNIGLNSACDIMIYAKNYETKQDNEIIQQKFCLTVNSSVEIDAEFDFAETMYYEFRYRDLKSNQYSQEFRYNENTIRSFNLTKEVICKFCIKINKFKIRHNISLFQKYL